MGAEDFKQQNLAFTKENFYTLVKRIERLEDKDAVEAPLFDNSENDKYLTLKEAGEYLSLSSDSLRRKIGLGEFPSYRLPGGGNLRLKKSEMDARLDRVPLPRARKEI